MPLRYNHAMRSLWLVLFVTLAALGCTGTSETGSPQPAGSPTDAPRPSPTPGSRLNPSTMTEQPPTAAAAPLTELEVEHVFPAISFRQMVNLTYPDDDTNRLFLVLQPGRIMVFRNDPMVTSATTFLDMRDRVNDTGREEGLLGLAFDPDYRNNGYFYVYYSASEPRRSVISRFTVSQGDPDVADADSERIFMEVRQPYSNHNGGQLLLGPDGYLYIGLGDGGRGGDPHGNGQNTSTLLGSILRIDVSDLDRKGTYSIPPDNPLVGEGGGARQEIWAYGLRNPWRFTFDRLSGELWAGDVGQDRFEEVDLIQPGLNYGWNVMEGFHCFKPSRSCDQEGLEPPVIEYSSSEGCSVIGGYVYRGPRLPSLYGAYLYGDFCSGRIWALRYDGSRVTEHLELIDSQLDISSFGEDQSGEIFILSFDEKIYRLTQR